jgi:alkanesulfonate monooxygenase SsuD/methylene tetrahydromethanopterin reductase-like flavin-dependent oxidoreductase (luciferase family)
MRYGLELPIGGVFADARFLAELAALAEAAGWDGVFLEDYIVHHLEPDAPTVDPWVALTAMALATSRVRLGTTVTPLTRRRPWKLARETATLDRLSGGRLILGVGLGDVAEAGFRKVGEALDPRVRGERLDEALAILVGLWSGEPFAFAGRHYQLEEVTFRPVPLQRPRIPIWVGGNWPHRSVLRRAARWDGFVGGKEHGPGESWCLTPDEVRDLGAEIARERVSQEPYEIALGGAVRGAITGDLDGDRAWIGRLAAAGATWWMEYVWQGGPDEIRAAIAAGPLCVDR